MEIARTGSRVLEGLACGGAVGDWQVGCVILGSGLHVIMSKRSERVESLEKIEGGICEPLSFGILDGVSVLRWW